MNDHMDENYDYLNCDEIDDENSSLEEDYDETDYDEEEDNDNTDPEEAELLNKIKRQSEEYNRRIEKLKAEELKYKEAKEKYNKKKHDGNLFYKSKMEGDTIIERLGYDKEAKKNPKPGMVENFIDTRVQNPKARIAIYLGIIVICAGLLIYRFFIA